MKTKLKASWPVILIFLISLIAGIHTYFHPPEAEYIILDTQNLIIRQTTLSKESPGIILLLIDQKSRAELNIPTSGSQWRKYHTRIVRTLTKAGCKGIIFDIQFITPAPEDDPEFAGALREAGNAFGVHNARTPVIKEIKDAFLGTGNSWINTRRGLPRKVGPYPAEEKNEALSLIVARWVTGRQMPSSYLINYKKPASYFPVFSYTDLLKVENERIGDPYRTPLALFRGALVLIGYADEEEFTLPGESSMAGVFAHTYGLAGLIEGWSLKKVPFLFLLPVMLLIPGLWFAEKEKKKISKGLLIILGPLSLVGQNLLIARADLWLPLVPLLQPLYSGHLGIFIMKWFLYRRRLKGLECKMKEFQEFSRKIQKIEEKRNILTATLVHDIKNYTGSIENSIQLLTHLYGGDEKTAKYLKLAKVSCDDIAHLSTNLIDTTRLEEGGFNLTLSPCRAEEIILMASKFTQNPLYEMRRITAAIHPMEEEFTIKADLHYLERVLQNLYHNASKYTNPGGEIILSFDKEKNWHRLLLYNTGEPISPEQSKIIFEKFIQVGGQRSPYSRGLGLYFCKMVMEAHGGDILVEAAPGGNRFILIFP